MSEYEEIREVLLRRPEWQLVGFAVGCAERLLPMAASLGGPSLAQLTEAGLTLAWQAAAGLGDPAEIEQALAALTDAIYQAEDNGLVILGAHAANVTAFALEEANGSTRDDWAGAAGAGVLHLAGEVDVELAAPPATAGTAAAVSGDDEMRQRPLKRAELGAQRRSLELLDTGHQPDVEALEAVRQLSRRQAAELARVMPEFARRRGRRLDEFLRHQAALLAEAARQRERKRL